MSLHNIYEEQALCPHYTARTNVVLQLIKYVSWKKGYQYIIKDTNIIMRQFILKIKF